ncbi:uncharacterized protein DS421_16g541540 [Arachis hypogaea]|nr:uncharacterized protein DS421_16g541540 [Arachis hypogaea]
MSEEKKAIVRDVGFGGLMHIPPMKVHHKLLKELANSFKAGKNTLKTSYGSFRVKPSTIGAALGLNASRDLFPEKVSYKELSKENKQIFKRFQGKTLKSLTDEMMSIGVGNEQDRLMFKRIFVLYIQMAFLLPTTINKISPVHLAPIFKMDKIKEGNWGAHVLNFIIKDITNYNLKKKKSIDGYLFALMIVYFYLLKNKDKKGEERAAQPWIANWNREQLVERMRAKMDRHMSETEEDSEGPKRKQPTRTAKKTQSKKSKLIVEDSSPEQTQSYHGEKGADLQSTEGHYDSSETIPEVNLGSDDPLSQGHTDQSSINKPADSMLSLVEESANDPAEENMMVVRVETQSQTEALSIVPIQVYLPLSQTTPVPEIEPTPAKSPTLQNHPPKPEESTPTLPPAPSKINPAPKDAAALTMMARTSFCIPKEGLMPSFSLGLTDSSQEEAATQEGEREKTLEMPKLIEQLGELVEKIASSGVKTEGKSPQIQKQSGEESFEKFETPARTNEMSAEMKEKCYI